MDELLELRKMVQRRERGARSVGADKRCNAQRQLARIVAFGEVLDLIDALIERRNGQRKLEKLEAA